MTTHLDAFDKDFRTVLLYRGHPVAFLSKALSEQLKKNHTVSPTEHLRSLLISTDFIEGLQKLKARTSW